MGKTRSSWGKHLTSDLLKGEHGFLTCVLREAQTTSLEELKFTSHYFNPLAHINLESVEGTCKNSLYCIRYPNVNIETPQPIYFPFKKKCFKDVPILTSFRVGFHLHLFNALIHCKPKLSPF